jgi:hypothetical protein
MKEGDPEGLVESVQSATVIFESYAFCLLPDVPSLLPLDLAKFHPCSMSFGTSPLLRISMSLIG